ncbi:MAG: tripeptide aminopeptidase PepT, partial [Rhodothermales bacterium]|nr:tripeptide aminopeptidase PepT [Rhodothermales bacterium]
MPLPPVAERFLRYVRIDTRSDPASHTVPSTEAQKTLGRLLRDELRAMGAAEVVMNPHGYVFATIPATSPEAALPVLALLAHQDTSPDAPGADVRPVIHASYDGGVLRLPGDERVVLDPARQPALRDHLGHDVITSDGTTLLGSDDKAGVAILMQLAEDLLADHTLPCPRLRLCFTVDEEIGRGVDHLDLAVLGADVAYTLDGSGTDTLYSETFNAAEALVTVEGIMVHPGYAHGIMVNAARILSDLIAALPPDEAPETTSGRAGYFHPHTLDAADAARARARILLRDFTDAGLLRRKNFVHAHAEALRLRYPKARITVEI